MQTVYSNKISEPAGILHVQSPHFHLSVTRTSLHQGAQNQQGDYPKLFDMASTGEGKGQSGQPVINIAADGDVILIVGPAKWKMRVQSLILRAVSKPFSAMLGPNWKEGRQKPAADAPMELQLPDDDAVGMKYLCAVMHHQNKMIPATLPVQDVLNIAVLADKYDFVDAFSFTSAAWLLPGNKEARDLMTLAAAASWFQNAQAFKAITKALIVDYGDSYLDLFDQGVPFPMGWRVVCKSDKWL